ncbi:MAG: hypothetical protein TYPL_1940 [Candidatus Tyloplasma litorale]|nr:MAG: hypothetical protein TYPL_1940 [Mycoplasmatales bacterium]
MKNKIKIFLKNWWYILLFFIPIILFILGFIFFNKKEISSLLISLSSLFFGIYVFLISLNLNKKSSLKSEEHKEEIKFTINETINETIDNLNKKIKTKTNNEILFFLLKNIINEDVIQKIKNNKEIENKLVNNQIINSLYKKEFFNNEELMYLTQRISHWENNIFIQKINQIQNNKENEHIQKIEYMNLFRKYENEFNNILFFKKNKISYKFIFCDLWWTFQSFEEIENRQEDTLNEFKKINSFYDYDLKNDIKLEENIEILNKFIKNENKNVFDLIILNDYKWEYNLCNLNINYDSGYYDDIFYSKIIKIINIWNFAYFNYLKHFSNQEMNNDFFSIFEYFLNKGEFYFLSKKMKNKDKLKLIRIFFIYDSIFLRFLNSNFEKIEYFNFEKIEYNFNFGLEIENYLNKEWISYINKLKEIKEKYLIIFEKFNEELIFFDKLKSLNKTWFKMQEVLHNNLIIIWKELDKKFFWSIEQSIHGKNGKNDFCSCVRIEVFKHLKSFSFKPLKKEKNVSWYTPENIKFNIDENFNIFDENEWKNIENEWKNNLSRMLDLRFDPNRNGHFLFRNEANINFKNLYKKINNLNELNENDPLIKKYIFEIPEKWFNENKNLEDIYENIEKYRIDIYNNDYVKFLNNFEKVLFLINTLKNRIFEMYNPDFTLKINL